MYCLSISISMHFLMMEMDGAKRACKNLLRSCKVIIFLVTASNFFIRFSSEKGFFLFQINPYLALAEHFLDERVVL